MKCPKCNSDKYVICHGRRYALYPSGCLAVLGPFLAILHQASTPVDYECKSCDLKFAKRSTAAKVALFGILLFVAYLIWITYVDISIPPEH
jgi:transcription elongation factor Elf1